VRGEEVDRVPVACGNTARTGSGARAPGRADLLLQRQFDTDLIKLTPNNLTYIQDWGATIKFSTQTT